MGSTERGSNSSIIFATWGLAHRVHRELVLKYFGEVTDGGFDRWIGSALSARGVLGVGLLEIKRIAGRGHVLQKSRFFALPITQVAHDGGPALASAR